jgi:hypothetical protein
MEVEEEEEEGIGHKMPQSCGRRAGHWGTVTRCVNRGGLASLALKTEGQPRS